MNGNNLIIPGHVSDIGRWTGSAPMTGNVGTVLLAGHIDNINQGKGALHNLVDLHPGDKVYLSVGGIQTVWVINSLQQMNKAALPQNVFTGNNGPRQLFLVTCAGKISNGEYDDNAVAGAVPAT